MGLEMVAAEVDRGSAGGQGEVAGKKNGRLIMVGMKLSPECRELLTWALAKLAMPGDRVRAVHVALSPSSRMSKSDVEVHKFQLAGTFCSVLSVYEGLCSMRQVDLQVRIVNGTKVRRALIEEVRSHDGSILVLGASRHPGIGQDSFGKYCLNRLPSTWSVVVVEKGRVIFERKGKLPSASGNGNSSTRPGVMNALQRSFKAFSLSASMVKSRTVFGAELRKDRISDSFPESESPRAESTNSFSSASGGCRSDSFSGSLKGSDGPHSPVSVLRSPREAPFETFRLSMSRKRVDASFYSRAFPAQDSITSKADGSGASAGRHSLEAIEFEEQLEDAEENEQDADQAWAPCTSGNSTDPPRFCFSPSRDRALCPTDAAVQEESGEGDAAEGEAGERDDFQIGWPLRHRDISSRTLATPQEAARSLSVVRWALNLPSRSRMVLQSPKCLQLKAGCEKIEPARHSVSSFPAPNRSLADLRSVKGFRSLGDSGTLLSEEPVHVRRQKLSSMSSFTQTLENLCKDKKCRPFTYAELELATDNFSEGNLVGKGGCSRVFKGHLSDGSTVAVKSFLQERADALKELLTEVEIITSLNHSRIVSLLGYCVNGENLCLVYNFLAGGNLEENLHGSKDRGVLEWNIRQQVAVGVAEGLNYLHEGCPRRVFHRDIKASNILLSADFEPLVSDFGLAKWAPEDATYIDCGDVVGTFGYLAPEYFLYGRVDDKTDVYSFGVVLLELITGQPPIDSSRPKGQENIVSWAQPLLDEVALDKLVDPQLEGRYDSKQLSLMVFAASLCVRQSAPYRPKISRILRILSGDTEDLMVWLNRDRRPSPEMDEECSKLDHGKPDMQIHMALAMLGVDDNDDAVSEDLAPTNKSLEEYMNGRYSRSSSFD